MEVLWITDGLMWMAIVIFFTVALENRKSNLLIQHIETLRAAFKYVKERHPFTIDAMVVLPDHLHCIWTLPEGDCDYAKLGVLIKVHLSKKLTPQLNRMSFKTVSKAGAKKEMKV